MITRRTGVTVAPELPAVSFDATYGYDLTDLLGCGAPDNEPADLDQVWRGIREEALATDSCVEIGDWRPFGGASEAEVATIAMTGLDGIRSNGWLVRTPGELRRALVVGHGYGGRSEPGDVLPAGCLSIQLSARGQVGSEVPGMPSPSREHVLHGIESVRTYSHTGCVADVWSSVSVLAELAPGVPIGYQGGSFGGGIGAMAAAYEDRFDAVQLTVPSFGNHPLRLQLPCTASGEAVRLYAQQHPEVIEVLRYVDAATLATRVTVPVLCVAALADPGVPPPGQFAVATSLAGPTWLHCQPGGHAEWATQPADLAESAAKVAEFWTDPVAATSP